MDADLLELARTVDLTVLGPRVKRARVAKRLTQTEVAGSEMSTAYVSRIESGQRRPDPDLLLVIAERVGVSIDELVMGTTRDQLAELRLALVSAEVEIKTGEAGSALRRLDETLMDLAGQGQQALQVETLRLKAAALEAVGRLDEAIILLEDLTDGAEHDTLWLRDMTGLCRCYRVSGDLTRSVETGEQAQRTLRDYGLESTDEASALTLSLAAAYFEAGQVGVAARLCRRAIDRAETLSSSTRGATYWAASIMESRRGYTRAAVRLAHKALAHIEVGEDQRQLASVRSQLGMLQLRGDAPDPRSALANLERAGHELAASEATTSVVAANLVAQARAHYFLGDSGLALDRITEARSMAGLRAPLVEADALVLMGQIEMGAGRVDAAMLAYRDAVASLSAVGADRSAAQLWFELGGHFESIGQSGAALDAFRRAGASTGLTAVNTIVDIDTRIELPARA